jgi:hypothetical protein
MAIRRGSTSLCFAKERADDERKTVWLLEMHAMASTGQRAQLRVWQTLRENVAGRGRNNAIVEPAYDQRRLVDPG